MADSAHSLDERVASQQGLVRALALKVHRRLPPHVELDDLIGYGQVGLAEAARDFDASRGYQFSTFAYHRIRGAILDGLRQLTWFRQSRPAWIGPQAAADDLQVDLSERLVGDPARWLHDAVASLAAVFLFSQTSPQREDPWQAAQETSVPPDVEFGRRELREVLRRLVKELPVDEALVVETVYFEGGTITEAARRLNVGKPWASRLHARALEGLARSLRRLNLAD